MQFFMFYKLLFILSSKTNFKCAQVSSLIRQLKRYYAKYHFILSIKFTVSADFVL